MNLQVYTTMIISTYSISNGPNTHGGQGFFNSPENVPKMIRNMFMYFDPFLVGKNATENGLSLVTKYIGSIENLIETKTLRKC